MSLLQAMSTSGKTRGRVRGFVRVSVILLAALLVLVGVVSAFTMSRSRALAATNGPALSVDATAASYAIQPEIYGACGYGRPSDTFARELKLPLCRWGGDNTSRYNWQVNATNSGVDYYFIGGGSSSSTPGANVDAFIDQNNAVGARSLVSIPIIPLIEKSNDQVCAFSVKKYGYDNVAGSGTLGINWNGNGANDCANGTYTANSGKSGNFTTNDPSDTSTANSPALQAAWVKHLVQRYGPSSQSRIMYGLDNEPSNWGYLHRDVYKKAVNYTDLINYTLQYAPAIKQADPTATLIGPNDIQFAWYPDWGGTANMTKYLQAMKQYEQEHGQRILDVFSVHYPDANDNHWPKLTDVDAVRQVVDQNYPGTKIGFDEWNFGADTDPLGGALATADQLGIFARNKVAEAAYWVLDDATKPPAYAFRMYRNYDGQGKQFGNTYLQSSSADVGQLSVYGARRSSDGAVTVMVVNKTGNDLTSPLSLKGIIPTGNAQVYQYSTANTGSIVRLADQSASSNTSSTFKANSLTLLVIPTNGQTSTPTPAPSSGWTQCSSEGGTCSFTGTKVVRYGANGTYAYKTATGSIGCNNSVFGDPVPGTVKTCATASVPPTGWTKCSGEYGTCTVPGTVTVAYGANTSYVYKTVSGSIGCNNMTFGSDPAFGVIKACYYT